jgi:transposase
MATMKTYVGIDVAQDTLVVAVHGVRGTTTHANNRRSRSALRRQLTKLHPTQIVVEGTGGLERALVEELSDAGLPVRTANPARVRRLAEGVGQLAKTDPLDATVIAHFAAIVELPKPVNRSANERDLQAVVRRRAQLVEQRQAETCRSGRLPKAVADSLKRMQATLNREIARLDRRIAQLIAADPVLSAKAAILQSMPGVGLVIAAGLLGLLPELGHLGHKQLAALVGLAPYAAQSGSRDGTRHIRGGRGEVRRLLYLAALTACRHNPVIATFRARLDAHNKPKKQVLIAAARKLLSILNAMLRDGAMWQNGAPCA